MKKILLVFLVVLTTIILTSCTKQPEPIITGVYEDYQFKPHEDFSDARMILKEIKKSEYEKANGVNVFIDASSTKFNPRYISYEIYLFSTISNKFELVELTDIQYQSHSYSHYEAKAYLNVNGKEYVENNYHFGEKGSLDLFDIKAGASTEDAKITEGVYKLIQHGQLIEYNDYIAVATDISLKEITEEEYNSGTLDNKFISFYNYQHMYIDLSIEIEGYEEIQHATIYDINRLGIPGDSQKYEGKITFNLIEYTIEATILIRINVVYNWIDLSISERNLGIYSSTMHTLEEDE